MDSFVINVNTRDFVHVLGMLSGVIDKKNVYPILSNILMTLDDNCLVMSATSVDLALSVRLNVKVVSGSGATTVNAQTLLDMVRKLPDSEVALMYNVAGDSNFVVKGRKFESSLETLPSHDFPVIDDVEPIGKFDLTSRKFLRLLESTAYSMSNEETRYNICGIYLSYDNGSLVAAALDGHRLSVAYQELECVSDVGMIIPKKAVFEMIKMLRDSRYIDIDLFVTFDNSRIVLSCSDLVLTSKLVDATFPDYRMYIPQDYNHKITILSDVLSAAVDRVGAITSDKQRAIKVDVSDDRVILSAIGEAKGRAEESIMRADRVNEDDDTQDAFVYEGSDPIIFGLNPRYLVDALSVLKEQEVEILLEDANKPITIKNLIHDKDIVVIMPLRV